MSTETIKKLKFVGSFLSNKMVHLNLQLLYNCNFQCRICDFWKESFSNHNELSLQQIEKIAQALKPISPLVISIGGGEPLMHKDIFNITEVLAKDNFPVMICNGWFITPEIAKKLFKAGMHEVSISIDYADAEKHDAQRGKKGAYEKAMQALKYLNENRVHPSQRVHLISVVMDDNLDQIEPLINIAKEMGITYMVTFYSNQRGAKPEQNHQVDVAKYLLDLKNKYKEFVSLPGYLSRFSEANSGDGVSPCYAGKNLFNIDSQGNVTRCIDRLDDVAGNIFTDKIETIQENLNKQFKADSCSTCWTSCRGSIETLMYGENKIKNYRAYFEMTKKIKLN
jgi:radical SAM protein with 4Fe4S-binding SPASM domain